MYVCACVGLIPIIPFQMIWFRENWYEELLRQLNEGLTLCQAAAFESRADGESLHTNGIQLYACIYCTFTLTLVVFSLSYTNTVNNTRISPQMMQFVRKLVSTFGIGLEQSGLASSTGGGPLSQEALAKRAQAAAQDPAFQRLKAQFANDFDFGFVCVCV